MVLRCGLSGGFLSTPGLLREIMARLSIQGEVLVIEVPRNAINMEWIVDMGS